MISRTDPMIHHTSTFRLKIACHTSTFRSKNAYSQENLQKSLGKGVALVRVAFRNHVEKLQKLP